MTLQPPPVWDKGRQGAFVICLTRDTQGNVWAGTEDKGVWRFDASAPKGKQWKQFTVKDGLGDDNAYALTVDHQGRVWAGHLNHGVSVWNGKAWKNYGVLDGPLGERIFALTVDAQGDVWMATNAGLTRYIVQSDNWRNYTQADGLPSNAIGCLAADSFGNIYAGTQADGIAISSSLSDYKNWRVVKGADTLPLVSRGEGLPSNLISDILVTRDDTLYVATTSGLARSYDHGETWRFVRGMNWVEKANGLLKPAKIKREGELGALLREDYVTSLSEDAQGRLWIGYRQKGFEVRSPKQDFKKERVLYQQVPDEKVKKAKLPYVSAILPAGGNTALFSNYGEGLQSAEPAVERVAPDATPEAIADLSLAATPSLPSRAAAPSREDLEALRTRLEQQKTPLAPGQGAYLGDDWRTQGDWVGRYGRQRTTLCAYRSPFDHNFYRGMGYDLVIGQLGPQHSKGDSLRYWVHWLKTDNPRSLYDPILGYRRQAEWDDHGEAYPMSQGGPDLWVAVKVPEGAHRLSFYFFNKDGHAGNNRLRDYRLELRAVQEALPSWPTTPPEGPKQGEELKQRFDDFWGTWWQIIGRAEAQPVVARARVRDFWGGVYKQFVVRGPSTYWLKVARNNSFNTILSSVMIDQLTGPKNDSDQGPMSWMGGVRDNAPDPDAPEPTDPHLLEKILAGQAAQSDDNRLSADETKIVASARALWNALDKAYDFEGTQDFQVRGRLMAYRAVASVGWGKVAPPTEVMMKGNTPKLQTLLAAWRRKMSLWTVEDRDAFQQRMALAHDTLLELNPEMQGKEY